MVAGGAAFGAGFVAGAGVAQGAEVEDAGAADRASLPKGMPTGWDFEKYLFAPGIYDAIHICLTPHSAFFTGIYGYV